MLSNESVNFSARKPIKRKSALTYDHRGKKSTSRKVSFSNEKESLRNNLIQKNNDFISNFLDEEIEEDNNSIDEQLNQQREKQLELLNEKFTRLYNSKDKIYENIIKEIDVEKNLVYKGSIMSFNLIILKIKCLMKLLKEKLEYVLKSKDQKNYYEVDLYIQKVKNEFKKIYAILNEDDKYEYEILTQNYCRFLYIMAIICSQKEEIIRSFNYVSLGVNMLKVYFVRQSIASSIETYRIYAKLLIMLINQLISDNNISQSLIYINYLSRICQIALIIIYKNKLDIKYEYKFNQYLGYTLLFFGYCSELNNSNLKNYYQICAEIYKEAYYFMFKSANISIFYDPKTVITIEKKGLSLSQILFEKLKEKLILDALEKQRKFEQQELLKKQLIEEAKTKEKKFRLKLIASGFTPDPPNLVKAKKRLYNEILTPSNQKLMDKLDDELISYVYKHRQNEKNKKMDTIKVNKGKKSDGGEKRLPSLDVMKSLCHYKMYNSLMSNDFKEFIVKNKNLEFNYPQRQKNSLDKIQKYLNRKMEINFNTETINIEKEKEKDKDKDKDKEPLFILKMEAEAEPDPENSINNKTINVNEFKILDIVKDNEEEEVPSPKNYAKLIKNYPSTKNRTLGGINNVEHSYIISIDKDKDKDKEKEKDKKNDLKKKMRKRCVTSSGYKISGTIQTSSKKAFRDKTINPKSLAYPKKEDYHNRKLDKYVFSRRYFKEVEYFENLTNKELDFQKKFLGIKFNNSKDYFNGYDTELNNNGKISRDEIYKSFLILHNKATYKERNYEKEMQSEIEFKNKPRIVGNVFKSLTNKTKEGKEVKNAMRKVLDRYIAEERKNNKKNQNIMSLDEIKKKNEYSIMKLNDNIKEINSLLISKINEAKNKNKFTDI